MLEGPLKAETCKDSSPAPLERTAAAWFCDRFEALQTWGGGRGGAKSAQDLEHFKSMSGHVLKPETFPGHE